MLTVIHGDHQSDSRQHLHRHLQELKNRGVAEVINLDGKSVSLTDVIQATQSVSLFGTDRVVVIELLHSRPKSQAKTAITAHLRPLAKDTAGPEIVLWEEKPLTAAQLKALGQPAHHHYQLPKTLFAFVEAVFPGNARRARSLLLQALKAETPEFVFAMLVRQVRLLIQVKSNPNLSLPGWQKQKLSRQASRFTVPSLLAFHRHLLELDIGVKTGHNVLPLDKSLQLVLVKFIQ